MVQFVGQESVPLGCTYAKLYVLYIGRPKPTFEIAITPLYSSFRLNMPKINVFEWCNADLHQQSIWPIVQTFLIYFILIFLNYIKKVHWLLSQATSNYNNTLAQDMIF